MKVTVCCRRNLIAAALVCAMAFSTALVAQKPASNDKAAAELAPKLQRPIASDADAATTRSLLERILAEVEKHPRPPLIEVTRAIVFSLAALASAWCAYQASRWNNVAGSRSGQAAAAARLASVEHVEAIQFRTFDATMLIHFLEAKEEGKERLAEFLRGRFRPDLKPAFEAWLKTEPFTNPSAPLSPILMAEYVLKEMTTAQRCDEEAEQHSLASATAARASNNFVLLTFLFATVLFLGSLANSLPSPTLRDVVSLSALLVFATTFIRLWTLPVAPWK